MKVMVLQEDLLKSLVIVSRFVSSRVQLPVLSNILLSAQKGKLRLAATNLEMGVSSEIGANVEAEGMLTIPARVFLELVGNLPPGQISLEVAQDQLKVQTQSFRAQIPGILASEFPSVPDKIEHTDFVLSAQVLQTINCQVVFASSVDDSRPVLTGTLFIFTNDKLRTVATDGFRLSCLDLVFANVKADKKTVLVPARLLDELAKITGEEEAKISLLGKEKQMLAASGKTVLTGRLLEGDFPDFERIIPKSATYKARVNREQLLRAVRTAAVFAREASGIVKLQFEKEKIVVVAESQQFGHEESAVEAQMAGGELAVAFNYRYILDFLNSITGEEVAIETEGTTSPGVFRDTKDEGYTHLIMPFKIQTP